MNHNLKIKQGYLIHILEGRKTYEIRKKDRDFQTGDTIRFLPIESDDYNAYSGMIDAMVKYSIDYIHEGFGLEAGYVCMSISKVQA